MARRSRYTIVDDPQDDPIADAPPMVVTEVEPVTAPVVASCVHCGAKPPQPTRDGIHKCQCRMERV